MGFIYTDDLVTKTCIEIMILPAYECLLLLVLTVSIGERECENNTARRRPTEALTYGYVPIPT